MLTDSVMLPPPEAERIADRVYVLSVAGLFAEAIRCFHTGGSIVELLRDAY